MFGRKTSRDSSRPSTTRRPFTRIFIRACAYPAVGALFIAALITGVKYFARLDKNTHWLIKVIALIFVFFTLSGSRRSYYILPIIPFCALLTAVILTRMKEFRPSCIIPAGFTIQKWILFGAAALELLVFLALLIVPPRERRGFTCWY
ncbi:MAG: hypothetical protein HS132_17750 [Planctomycetia bacterium]|nr:hypothetical protein [Planctomycetia bacterium]